MIILKRWKAILGWAVADVLLVQGFMWFLTYNPPGYYNMPVPAWFPIMLLFVFACAGAGWCVST